MKHLKKFNLKKKSIFVAGHNGMVGSAVLNELEKISTTILTVDKNELDLRDEKKVAKWFAKNKPQVVIIAAAKVGGIKANNIFPVDFLENNLRIQNNIIKNAFESNVEKLVFLGSSCIYPRESLQPIKEEYLLTGSLEPTNEWYALAKLSGLKLCEAYRKQYNCDFISLIPTNLYGPNDNFHPEYSHVPAALIRKFHEAKINGEKNVYVWGTGIARREFLHVSDLAKAIIFMLENYSGSSPINIGTGIDITIREFARMISKVVGFDGNIRFDKSKPDGMILKRLDVSRAIKMGWNSQIDLTNGLDSTYKWSLKNIFT
jgi:GDP-L-fucose synthase